MPWLHASMKQCAWKLCRRQAMGKMGESSWYTNNHWDFRRWNNFATWISCLVLHESMSSKTLCYLCQCSIELLRSWPFLHLYSRKRWVASLFMAIPIDHNKIINMASRSSLPIQQNRRKINTKIWNLWKLHPYWSHVVSPFVVILKGDSKTFPRRISWVRSGRRIFSMMQRLQVLASASPLQLGEYRCGFCGMTG